MAKNKEIRTKRDAALDWYNANKDKNAANNRERKFKKEVQSFVSGPEEEIPISNDVTIKAGYREWIDEEVDPKLLMETNPVLFWQIVTVAKGAIIDALGEKGAAKVMRKVSRNEFKIAKIRANIEDDSDEE